MVSGQHGRIEPVRPYQHNYHDGDDGSQAPPDEWARLSSLPLPVVIGDTWSSLFAAQREKSRLLETQSYAANRVAEIDRNVRTVMDTKQERDPDLHIRYIWAQVTGAMHAVGLTDNRLDILGEIFSGRLESWDEFGWQFELDKQFIIRERLSPMSLIWPPPAM